MIVPDQGNRHMTLHMALSMVEDTTCVAYIRGKKGYILIEKPFHSPDSFIHNGVSCLVEVVAKTCV